MTKKEIEVTKEVPDRDFKVGDFIYEPKSNEVYQIVQRFNDTGISLVRISNGVIYMANEKYIFMMSDIPESYLKVKSASIKITI